MKAIMVMFDTLTRRFLPPYGGQVVAPNFDRLAARSVTFDTCYAGSMPCMPARREMHTGRHNFLHRSWGPIEPFDDSVPEMLDRAGVHTHLVSDHKHYWEDGGATYHTRYSTFEFFRGQEGDAWKGVVDEPAAQARTPWTAPSRRQDRINRRYLQDPADHPQTRVFDAGIEFVRTNADADGWFVQIETFDPHEPFFSYDVYRRMYQENPPAEPFDWPDYGRVVESDDEIEQVRAEYFALVSMCDASLGRVLDTMDELDLWDDTLLIVCTDHGFLLGERRWWGKNVQPWYDETIHTPLFVWDPRAGAAGIRRDTLVQTIDFGPTLLEFFGVPVAPDMQGRPLGDAVAGDVRLRDGALFGSFGGQVAVTDGRFVYMRGSATPENTPLYEHTLMPTHMHSRFTPEELATAELVDPLPFTKGAPVLRMPGSVPGTPWDFGTMLYDLQQDPLQLKPIVDDELELRMAELLVAELRAADAPPSQFERLGLPSAGPVPDSALRARQDVEKAGLSQSTPSRFPMPTPTRRRR